MKNSLDREVNMKTNAYIEVLICDLAAIIVSFFVAYLFRYKRLSDWTSCNYGIYITLLGTFVFIKLLVFLLYDFRRTSVVLMDPVDNLFMVIKGYGLLIIGTGIYLYLIIRSFLASRILIGLFFVIGVVTDYVFRMMFRKRYFRKRGVPGTTSCMTIKLSDDDVQEKIVSFNEGDYDSVLLLVNGVSEIKKASAIKILEEAGIRTYVALISGDRYIRSGGVDDINQYASVSAFVRKNKFELFGVAYSASRIEEAVIHVLSHLSELKGEYICFSNVHTLVMAKENKDYANVLNEAAFVFPDGEPIVRLQRKNGFERIERVAGPDFMANMFRATMDGKVSHFFYGSTKETLDALKENLIKTYPGISISGMYSPTFGEASAEEDEADIMRINSSGADIVWVGLGAPKQEKWMNAHKGCINGVMLGVGAGFDFHANTIKRAPVWIQKIGFEWLYRLIRDPRRLLKRYLVTNVKFLYYLFFLKIKQ